MGSTFCLSLWQGLFGYQEKEWEGFGASIAWFRGFREMECPMEELKDLRKHHVGTIELIRHELDK